MSAAPSPWTIRAPIRISALPARPHASEDAVKTARPTMKIRRRPSMSASFPPVSISTANVAVAVHDPLELGDGGSEVALDRRKRQMTIVLSSMIMNRPKVTAPSVNHSVLLRRFVRAPASQIVSAIPSYQTLFRWRKRQPSSSKDPTRKTLDWANVVRLMRRHGVDDYWELVRRSWTSKRSTGRPRRYGGARVL